MKYIFLERRKNFSEEEIQKIWEKADKAKDKKSGKLLPNRRFDAYGALMRREDYGDRNSEFGWEIDHKDENPDNNTMSNLRPLFWRNNLARNADNPSYYSYDPDLKKNI